MGMLTVTASDGHQLACYQADPKGPPKGGVLVIQEIFGVNTHIRSVCDGYASHGYRALAPAIFDRVERGVELGYDGEAMRRGVAIIGQLKQGDVLKDLQAGIDLLATSGRVGVVGYCYGGTLTWVAACRLDGVAAASGDYGGQIMRQADAIPKAPTMLHFGEQDAMIPIADVDKLKQAHADVAVYVYPTGHGFNCDARPGYHAESARLALQRTLDLFEKHVARRD